MPARRPLPPCSCDLPTMSYSLAEVSCSPVGKTCLCIDWVHREGGEPEHAGPHTHLPTIATLGVWCKCVEEVAAHILANVISGVTYHREGANVQTLSQCVHHAIQLHYHIKASGGGGAVHFCLLSFPMQTGHLRRVSLPPMLGHNFPYCVLQGTQIRWLLPCPAPVICPHRQ